MTRIETDVIQQTTSIARQQDTNTDQNTSNISEKNANAIISNNQSNILNGNNVFLNSSKGNKFQTLFSSKHIEPIDNSFLKHVSNKALISKLTAIELPLSEIKETDISEQANAEIQLARVMIGEFIERMLILENAKDKTNNDNSSSNILPEQGQTALAKV